MKYTRVPVQAVAVLTTLLTAAAAQDKSTYYTVNHPDEFKINWKAFYDRADELTTETRRVLPHELDVAYGDDVKQRLDIYMPPGRPAGAPVFVFLHGGGFREGDRAHYGYVARPFAKHGIVTVVSSYRLAPRFHYPDQPEDARRVLAWVARNATKFGGDPDRVYIGGHSAGAILTASVCVNTNWLSRLALPLNLIKGCVPISGPYDLREHRLDRYVPDPAQRVEASPLLMVETPQPTIVAVGSVEPYVDSSRALIKKISSKRVPAELVVLPGLEHDQTALALGDEGSPLFQAVLRLIEGGSSRPSAP